MLPRVGEGGMRTSGMRTGRISGGGSLGAPI
jgi:hypothetical protein